MIRLIMVDAQALVRAGVCRLFRDLGGIRVVAECEAVSQVSVQLRRHPADVVVFTVHAGELIPVDSVQRLARAHRKLGLVAITEPALRVPAGLARIGAHGYVGKGNPFEVLVAAVQAAARGENHLSPDWRERLQRPQKPDAQDNPFDSLSQRELQVLWMVTQGRNATDIARELRLSPKTVATYRYRLRDKLAVRSEVELVHLAIRHGVIPRNYSGVGKQGNTACFPTPE